MSIRTGIFLALCCLFIGLHAHVLRHKGVRVRSRLSRNIPRRCVQNSVTPVSCAEIENPDALLPHPDDCQLFYYCEQSYMQPVCRQCPAGLHFNPKSHVCDWPDRAGCRLPTTLSPNNTDTSPASTDTTTAGIDTSTNTDTATYSDATTYSDTATYTDPTTSSEDTTTSVSETYSDLTTSSEATTASVSETWLPA